MKFLNNILPHKKYLLTDGTVIIEKRSKAYIIIPILLILTIISIKFTNLNFIEFFRNLYELKYIIQKIFNPNFNYLSKVIHPLIETIQMSLFGSFLGAICSIPFAYLAASNMTDNKIINWIFRFLFSILRTIPTLVNALIATFIFGIGSISGTIAIFIYSFSYVGKILYEQIENANMGAFEALTSMGLTKKMAFLKSILPQVLPTFLSTALYNFEGNVRYAAILGYVGAGGIGVLMNHNIGMRQYENLGTILLCVLITILCIENLSMYFRKKLM